MASALGPTHAPPNEPKWLGHEDRAVESSLEDALQQSAGPFGLGDQTDAFGSGFLECSGVQPPAIQPSGMFGQ